MKKLTPYIIIVIVIIVGYFANAEILKQYKDNSPVQSSSSTVQAKDNKVKKNGNSIDDKFETILVYPKKKALLEFELWDFEQNIFTNSDFDGKWSLIFTGYINCPDICPNTLNDLTHLYQALNKNLREQFQFTFFSVDPERDTPERMKAYLDNFHSDFIGVSGKKDQVDSLVHQLGGVYNLNKSEGEYYSVDHSGRIFIVDPDGNRFGILKSEVLQSKDKSQLVKELESLL